MKSKVEIQKLMSRKKGKKQKGNSFDLAIQMLGVSNNNPALTRKKCVN